MNPMTTTRLDLALKVREHVIRLTRGGGCFLGASLSCADLLVHLYTQVLRVAPSSVDEPDRDYLLVAERHDVPALYATVAELGLLATARRARPLDAAEVRPLHHDVPGVQRHAGSPGDLLDIAAGLALDAQRRGRGSRVFVMLDDTEPDDGSIWIAARLAAADGLDNLVAIVGGSGAAPEPPFALEPLAPAWEALGWHAHRVDGHDFAQLDRAFAALPARPGAPTVVIADTVRNKGLPSLEGKPDRWFARRSPPEVEQLIAELHGATAPLLLAMAGR